MTTRHQRLCCYSRRLEAASVVAALVCTVVLCRLAPGPPADGSTRTAAAGTGVPASADRAPDDGRPPARERPGRAAGPPAEPLPRSAPVRVRVAGTGIDARVSDAPRSPDGSPPAPRRKRPMRVLWDRGGPAPGEAGPAVLVGPLDSRQGPAAFAGIGGVRPGTAVTVTRADGRTARFRIDTVERYNAGGVPDGRIYGDTEDAQLRLVARGGDRSVKQGPQGTVVVLARLLPDSGSVAGG